jgi:Spy/CpxP family protein refolding chaperone
MRRVVTNVVIGCIIVVLVSFIFGCKDGFGFRKGDGYKKTIRIVKKVDDDDMERGYEEEEFFFRGKGLFSKGGFPGKKHFKKGAKFYLKFEEELTLTENQVKELKSLIEDCEKETIKLKAGLKILMVDFKRIVEEDDIDLKEVRSMIVKMGDIKEELMYMKFEASEKAKKVLNSSQREKLKELKKGFRKKKGYHGSLDDD